MLKQRRERVRMLWDQGRAVEQRDQDAAEEVEVLV